MHNRCSNSLQKLYRIEVYKVNLPEKYTESMKMMLGDEYDSYIESFNDKRLYGLRVNNLKISTEDFLKICPFKLEPVPWIENGFYYSEDDKPAKHPYYFAGLYYIQEPSAMTPVPLMNIHLSLQSSLPNFVFLKSILVF